MPASSSTWITPMWAKPRAAPPPRARPMRGGRGTGGGVAGGGGVGGGSGGGTTVWQPAASSAKPAATKRLRAGVGGMLKAIAAILGVSRCVFMPQEH